MSEQEILHRLETELKATHPTYTMRVLARIKGSNTQIPGYVEHAIRELVQYCYPNGWRGTINMNQNDEHGKSLVDYVAELRHILTEPR